MGERENDLVLKGISEAPFEALWVHSVIGTELSYLEQCLQITECLSSVWRNDKLFLRPMLVVVDSKLTLN